MTLLEIISLIFLLLLLTAHLFPAWTPESCKNILNLVITIGSSLLKALRIKMCTVL